MARPWVVYANRTQPKEIDGDDSGMDSWPEGGVQRPASSNEVNSYKKVWAVPSKYWGFLGGVPQNGWFTVENPMKMDDLGVPPL